jgi:soluble lytic murein transglycosylase-like protein
MFLRPIWGVAVYLVAFLCGCSLSTSEYGVHNGNVAKPHMERTLNAALSWPKPAALDALYGARLIVDGSSVPQPDLSIARAILRTNPRITAAGALLLSGETVRAARAHGLPPEYLGATLLQESAYDPNAISEAGAVGVAQFTIDTADDAGVNPFEPLDAIDGAATLISGYVRAYAGRYDDPYVDALAAYNAGPAAVAHYRGVPPYSETRDYVAIIYDRWARIGSYERAPSGRKRAALKAAR